MKHFFLMLLASVTAFAVPNPPISVVPSAGTEFIQNRQMGPAAFRTKLGTQVRQAHNTAVGVWDFSVQGGALNSVSGIGINLPANAIVRNVLFDTVTAVQTSASGTLGFEYVPNGGTLKVPTAAATWSGRQTGSVIDTVATMLKPSTAASIVAVIGTGAITAGKVKVFVDYVLSE